MSTVWRALCLAHDPLILVDLVNGGSEVKRWELAVEVLPTVRSAHPHCDLVLGGFSYPLMRVVCPGDGPGCAHTDPTQFDAETLRLALTAPRAASATDDPAHQALGAAHDAWLRRNRCWTKDRLERLAPELLP
jgi:hypothetical protein